MIHIEIPGWHKYNPRNDVKSCTWFRFENSFFLNHALFGATNECKIVWIFILCSASKKLSSSVKINTKLAAAVLQTTEEMVKNAMNFLHQAGCIEFSNKPNDYNTIESDRIRSEPLHTDRQTNIQTNTEKAAPSESEVDVLVSKKTKSPKPKKLVFDIESLYKNHYPRKEGKKIGMEKLTREIKTQDQFDSLKKAVLHYRQKMAAENKDMNYIKQFSTFANCWEDYIEAEDEGEVLSEDFTRVLATMQETQAKVNSPDFEGEY